jgi:UDP-glucose 4-epimerase
MSVSLVTGGAGFIGSHLVEALLGQGHSVRVLDNFSTGSRDNLTPFLPDLIELIEGDVSDEEAVREAMRGVDLVFHQAALPCAARSVEDPFATHRACTTGTLQVLQAACQAGVRRVIYAASSSAYGNSERLPKSEADPTAPLSPYAVAKLAGEQYCTCFSHMFGLETVRLRYFSVFGPRQNPDGPYAAVIPRLIRCLLAGQSPTIHGDGRQSRDFTFVRDVVRASLLAAEAPDVSGKVYNIACGRRTSLLELVTILNELLGTFVKPEHIHPRPGDVRHSQADITRAERELGYLPSVSLRQGLRRCVEYYAPARLLVS